MDRDEVGAQKKKEEFPESCSANNGTPQWTKSWKSPDPKKGGVSPDQWTGRRRARKSWEGVRKEETDQMAT